MPVTMPGSAIGSRISSVTPSLPKKRKRYMAAAARVPRISATIMATQATRSERPSACQGSSRAKATPNHWVGGPGGDRHDHADAGDPKRGAGRLQEVSAGEGDAEPLGGEARRREGIGAV